MPGFIPDADLVLEPCDVFLTKGTGVIARAIRFFTQSFGEKRAKANHVGIIVVAGSVHSAVAVEALSKVKRHPLGRYRQKAATGVAVFRPINLNEEERAAIVAKANGYVGRKYGWQKIVTHLLDWGLNGAFVFRRLTQKDDYPICSWVVAYAYLAAGKDFGAPAGAANPDDIWDFVTANPKKYRQVRDLIPLPQELSTTAPV